MSDCKHGWTTPPECPQCVSDERDKLAEELTRLRAELAQAKTDADKLNDEVQVEIGFKLAAREELEKAKADRDAGYKIACQNAAERDKAEADAARMRGALIDALQFLRAYEVPEGAAISQAREALAATEPAPVIKNDIAAAVYQRMLEEKGVVPLEDAEALAKALEGLHDELPGSAALARLAIAAFRAKHPAPVAQACDAH